MSVMTGKQALMECLVANGVEYLFGNPGTMELPIIEALQDYPQVQYILGLQETVPMAMANGYARASGKAGVVQLHITVGVGNGITMLYNSLRGGASVVVLAGQQDSRLLLQEPGLYSDMVRLTRPVTKWSAEVTQTGAIPVALRRALKVATDEPTGPTFVSFTTDALNDSADLDLETGNRPYSRVRPDPEGVQQAARLLAGCERPVVVVADGVARSRAVELAVAMAEMIGARVYGGGGLTAEVNFPTGHPQYSGGLNLASPGLRQVLAGADVLLGLGGGPFTAFRYDMGPAIGKDTRVVHIDVNPWEVGKNVPVDVGLVGDPRRALEDLVQEVGKLQSPTGRQAARERAEAIAADNSRARQALRRQVESRWDAVPISGARLLQEVQDAAIPQRVIVHEAFASRAALEACMEFNEPGSYFGLQGGGIGWGLPATLGVKLARPESQVIGIVGDGSAMYSIQALWTAAHHNIPAVFVIYNNASYRILKTGLISLVGESRRRPEFIGLDLDRPGLDFSQMARALGVHGRRVEYPEEIGPALREALSLGKPALVDVVVDGSLDQVM